MEGLLYNDTYSYWLDSGGCNTSSEGIHILGSSQERIEYWQEDNNVLHYTNNNTSKTLPQEVFSGDILSYLDLKLRSNNNHVVEFVDQNGQHYNQLPFDFCGGYVGFLGYEVRHDTRRFLVEQSPNHQHQPYTQQNNSRVPTAAFVWADKSYVYWNASWYLVGVARTPAELYNLREWMNQTADVLSGVPLPVNSAFPKRQSTNTKPTFVPTRSRETYKSNVDECMEYIRQGESYELCVTNALEATVPKKLRPLDLYQRLRRRNTAPFSAYFNWNARGDDTKGVLAVCCSSPERFVSVKRNENGFQVEAKPIKGTCARVAPSDGVYRSEQEQAEDDQRAEVLRGSVKNRAENLMIVDLLRNDLSRVCKTGSVHVAKLMHIESYATVHQMVSTVRGTLKETSTAVDVLKACFPGGSMTGAPKLRTCELLDHLEEGAARGVYSGCLGYISVNGCMDMNIVIRTAVLTPATDDQWKVSIGAGGAIVALSESEDEYQEMLLKASAVIEAVEDWAVGHVHSTKDDAQRKHDNTAHREGSTGIARVASEPAALTYSADTIDITYNDDNKSKMMQNTAAQRYDSRRHDRVC
jgi:para-aminobenzoate synthetase